MICFFPTFRGFIARHQQSIHAGMVQPCETADCTDIRCALGRRLRALFFVDIELASDYQTRVVEMPIDGLAEPVVLGEHAVLTEG